MDSFLILRGLLTNSYVSRITAVVANKVGLRETHSMQVVANKGEVEVRVCSFFFFFFSYFASCLAWPLPADFSSPGCISLGPLDPVGVMMVELFLLV